MLGDHRDGRRAGVREREHGGEADVLGADDHRAPADRRVLQVDELLQRAGGEHAERARARAPGAPRAAARGSRWRGARRAARDLVEAGRAGEPTRARRAGPAGHRRRGADLDAGVARQRARSARRSAGRSSRRCRSRRPKPVCAEWRGMPPASASRSTTTTRATPRRRSSSAAARPAGPPPTIRTSGRRSWSRVAAAAGRRRAGRPPTLRTVEQRRDRLPARLGEQRRDRRRAVEPLAAAEQRAGAAAQAVERARRDGGARRVEDLAARHALAVADDAAVVGIGGDQRRRAGRGARTPRRCSACAPRAEVGAWAPAPRPASRRPSTTYSAIAIDADSPVERMPPTQT